MWDSGPSLFAVSIQCSGYNQYETLGITLDYMQLNQVTCKDSYPFPNIAECLDVFMGTFHFCALYLRSSFYQVSLAEEN